MHGKRASELLEELQKSTWVPPYDVSEGLRDRSQHELLSRSEHVAAMPQSLLTC